MADELLSEHSQRQVVNAVREEAGRITMALVRPSVLYRPRVYLDGDKWCALYGDNLQTGVCGFGDSPAKAMEEFDTNWIAQAT